MSNCASPSKQVSLFNKALKLVTMISPVQKRAIALNKIIEYIPNDSVDLLGRVLKLEYSIGEGSLRPTILFAVVKRLPEDAFSLWKFIIKAIKSTRIRHKKNPHFAIDSLLLDPVDLYNNSAIDRDNLRSAILNIVIERLSLDAIDLWDALLNEINRESNIHVRVRLLKKFAERKGPITANIWLSTLRQIRRIRNRVIRSLTLATVAVQLPQEQQVHLLSDALKAARKSKRGMEQVIAILNVAKSLPYDERKAVLVEVQVTLDQIINNEKLDILANLKALVSTEITIDSDKHAEELFTLMTYIHDDIADLWDKIFDPPTFFFSDNEQELELHTHSITKINAAIPLMEQLNVTYSMDYTFDNSRILNTTISDWKEACDSSGLKEEVMVANILCIFASKGRKPLLSAVKEFLPIIVGLGGERAVRETAQAILDTARWWP